MEDTHSRSSRHSLSREKKTDTVLQFEGTEIKINQISAMLKKKKAGAFKSAACRANAASLKLSAKTEVLGPICQIKNFRSLSKHGKLSFHARNELLKYKKKSLFM